ncbi:MAG: redox-sensing transcriptional repressor Rex [Candidatus Omnitrophica bacterium]|nr:redox-sensing transcriptional repressor Rex [Candidatus Omnitrophota bacterium]
MTRTNGMRRTNGLRRQIPEACVERLSLYVRELSRIRRQGNGFVSSRRLAQHLRFTDAQVRRDLNYFGQFGTSGRGYEIQRLLAALSRILGIQGRTWHVALAGAGNLGSALLAYRGFRERGFVFRVIVDADPQKVGRTIQGLTVASSDELEALMRRHRIHIGIITVPSEAAQGVCDRFVRGGVRAIVNFAPARLDVPPSVRLRNVDMALELEALAFYLGRDRLPAGRHGAPAAAQDSP